MAKSLTKADIYDLDAIALASTINFQLGGLPWKIKADPDVEVVATMLRIRDALRGDEDGREFVAALTEGRDLLIDLLEDVAQEQPVDRDNFRIGATQLLAIYTRMIGGEAGQDMADLVTSMISLAAAATMGEDLSEEEQEALAEGDADAAPLPSASSSSRRRSRSAGSTNGRRRGGGA